MNEKQAEVIEELVRLACRVHVAIEIGDLRPEPGAEKKFADLQRTAALAVEMARRSGFRRS